MRKKLLSVWGCLVAASAVAETPLLSEFVQGTTGESSPVRLEARMDSTVAGKVVSGKLTIPSPDGVSSKEWDMSSVANGWTEVTGGGKKDALLVLNPPAYAVEGGRLAANTTWNANSVHWVRNWVVVPNGVTLTVKDGAVVKFGEQTGIKVENGGFIDFQGRSDSRIVLTHFADDDYGGDSDFGKTNAWYGAWSVSVASGGAINDTYTHVRYGSVSSLPTISLPASVTAQRADGKARIPVTLSGSRANRMSLHWRTIDGTAKFGTDFSKNEGEAVWSNTSVETVYFEIPLIKTSDEDSVKTFRVEVASIEDANSNPERLITTVTIVSGTSMPIAKCVESGASAAIRLENRAPDAVGHALVRGIELKSSDPNSAAVTWDTTQEPEGWQTLTSGEKTAKVLVRNDAKVVVEGGRLASNTRWDSSAVHLVRNRVVVPSGVTLTIGEGTIVKFCEQTGIKVEDGGFLVTEGREEARAVLTSIADDDFGGDSDLRDSPPVHDSWSVETVGSGTISDVYTHVRYGTVSSLPMISLPASVTAQRTEGKARIPVIFSSGTSNRTAIHWQAIEGTAKHDTDIGQKSGEVVWNKISETTGYFEIPIIMESDSDEIKTFDVELVSVEDLNIDSSRLVTKVTIVSGAKVPVAVCAVSESSEAVRLEARTEGMIGKAAVVGTEWKAADGESCAKEWDTTPLGYAWQRLADGRGGTAQVLTLNDAKIAVEGGRLEADTVWDSNLVHVVRHTIVVPDGVTLSVTTNAVVKFCENTGVKVEAGGRFLLLGSLDENVYMTLANDDTVGGDTDKDGDRKWVEGAETYSVSIVPGGTFSDINAAIRGTTVATYGFAGVNAKTVVDSSVDVIRIPVFVSGSRTTQFSVDWKTSDGLRGRLVWYNVNEGTKWVTLNVADCSENFTFELCESRGINIDGAAKASEVTVLQNPTPLAVCAESESSPAVRIENRADGTFGKALCFGEEWRSADGDSRAEAWDTTVEANDWIDLGEGMRLLVRNDGDLTVEGGRLNATTTWGKEKVHVVRNWVVVPSGVTLTIEAGTVVKFAENTGFKVEAGGQLYVEGTVDAPVVYTAAEDDTIGGDTDKREVEPQCGNYTMNVVSGGTYSDRNCAIRYATFSNFGTAALPATAVANEKDGVVRVPMFISTSRTTAFCVDWRVASGTYATKGRLNWNTYGEGTKYIEIPLAMGMVKGEFDTFEIEMYESQGINVSTTERKCVVTVYPDKTFPAEVVFADSDESPAVRFENRDSHESYGAEIVCGVELKSVNGESIAEAWDTTQERDGWVDVTDGDEKIRLLVRNDESVIIEGGRLNETTTWSKDKVHVVRNWVVVPNGVTLTIAAGTVVKFCDETGIKVEVGGRLVSAGTATAEVVLTSINDDTVGGDTDFDDVKAECGGYQINVISGGTYNDTYTQMRYGESVTFGSASISPLVVAKKDGGVARIPLTISTTRTTPFSIDWVAHDGTAVYGEDYLCASGRVVWASSTQGTKYLEIPLNRLAPIGKDERFEIELVAGLGVNIDFNAARCEVDLYDTKDVSVGDNHGYAESAWSDLTMLDSNSGLGPKLVIGDENLTYSTAWVPNGVSSIIAISDSASNTKALHEAVAPAEGSIVWSPEGYEDGRYDLAHRIADDTGRTIKTDSVEFVINRDVMTHSGRLTANEIWDANKVHLVKSTVYVPSGVTLTIAPNAIVKFMPGTEIIIEDGGLGICRGAIITHAYDDAIGGDTFFDGSNSRPSDGAYKMTGDWEDDETTQYHYAAPIEVGGTIGESQRWPGFKTYKVKSNITLQSGVTLDIEPGAVIKFESGMSFIVNSGATLNAQGTRSAPIVFTSIKDDEHGGDTNGDGDSSLAMPGDWVKVGINGGSANFRYTYILYSSKNSTTGAINMNGGKVVFDNGIIAHGLYDAVGVESGNFYMTNSVITDCLLAFRHWPRDPIVNCVVYDCGRLTQGGGQNFVNCIFSKITDTWEAFGFPRGTTYRNCCFWNEGGSVLAGEGHQDAMTVCGNNGNIWGNPKFVDPENWDFRIAADSPCVDAGDGIVAPETDYYGQPRQSISTVIPTGIPSANGKISDIGLYEVQPRFVMSDVDLELTSIVAPETLTVGQSATVSWSVKNVGSESAVGQWVDHVELICANGTVVTLGSKLVKGGIAPGGSRIHTATWTVPPAQVGSVRIRVTTNANRDLFEGSQMANNVVEATSLSKVILPELELPAVGMINFAIAAGSDTAFRLGEEFADGGLIIVRSSEPVSVWTGLGQVPTADIFYAGAMEVAEGVYIVRVPETKDGYVTFANETMTDSKIEVESGFGAFQLLNTGIVSLPNSGSATVTLFGNGFDKQVEVYLEGNGTSIKASDIAVEDEVKMSATFNVDGLAAGNYSVRIVKEGAEVSGEVITITNAKIGPKWTCNLETISNIRSGRTYTGYLVYANVGDVALDAPYVVITATGKTTIRFSAADAWSQTLELMATSEAYPASELKPGESVRIPFFYTTSGNSADLQFSYTLSDPSALPWDTNGSYMRPSWANDEIWTRALTTLKQNVGLTWDAYLARMRKNCDWLQKIGTPTRRLERIWQLEINEALGIDHAVGSLADGTDIARSGRGFGLSFSRSYGSGMHQRLRKGILGYGWSDNLSVNCELQENGARFVIQSGNGSSYAFTKVTGVWKPEDARDSTVLMENALEWVLTTRSGTVVRFSKANNRFASIRDNMGNGLNLSHDANGNVTEVKHTDGQWLRFAYEGGLLVSAADDQGRTVSYAYTNDMLTEVTAFDGRKVKYNYLPADETASSRALRQIVAPDGQTKDFAYDDAGRVATASRNGSHFTTEVVRGELGSYAIIAPNGGVTEVTVGARGETLSTVNALGQRIQRTYTAETLLESVIAPSGKRSKIVYDTEGRVVKSTDAAGAATSFAYMEDFGSLKSVTDARQNAIIYGYDELGRSESVTYPDETSSRIAYAPNGDVTSVVNAKGETITYSYDAEGNRIRAVWPNGRVFSLAYDAKGNCTNAFDSVTGTVTMEYDDREQLTRIAYPGNRGFTYDYDAYGRVTKRMSFDGAAQKYEYDAFGRVARMTDGEGNLYVANAYDPTTGNLMLQTYGNGTTVSNAYDLLDRTISITHRTADGTVLEQFAYAYNEDGQRISLTTKEGVERYRYDAAGQVIGVAYPDGTEENFAYDAVGNRFATDEAVYTVNALNQYMRIEKDGTASTLTYDADGNLTLVETPDDLAEYFYDCENRLIAVTNALKGIAWSCEYDVFGNRVKVTDNGVTTEKLYVQGSLPSVAAEYCDGSLVSRHILSGAVRIADETGGTTRYYHADGLASTRLLTDAGGSVVARASYKAFGEIHTSSGIAITDGYVGTLGVELDSTGLLFMRNRYYDAVTGRFIQRDPIGHSAGDVNLMRYCRNDSVNKVDENGCRWGDMTPKHATYCFIVCVDAEQSANTSGLWSFSNPRLPFDNYGDYGSDDSGPKKMPFDLGEEFKDLLHDLRIPVPFNNMFGVYATDDYTFEGLSRRTYRNNRWNIDKRYRFNKGWY